MMWDKGIEACIFDLDGTLIDSTSVWTQLDKEYGKDKNLVLPADIQAKIKGMEFSAIAELYIDFFNLTITKEELIKDWLTYAYNKYANEVPLKTGVKQFLTYCKAQGWPLMIATSCNHHLVDAVLKQHDISHFFDEIITSDKIGASKAQPDIYLYCANKFDVDPGNILVFEDILIATKTASNAGFRVISIFDEDSKADKAEIEKYAAHYIQDYTMLLEEY